MSRKFIMQLFLFLGMVSAGLFLAPKDSPALNCQEVRQLTSYFLRLHYSHHSFDDELSERTLDNFVKFWDPGKVYFLKADIEDFEKKYSAKLDDMINAGNCSAIEDIVATYSKRFKAQFKVMQSLVDKKYDFTKDEYMDIDRKKLAFATNSEELNERWRKRIKYQFLMLNDTVQDETKVREKLHKRYDLLKKRYEEQDMDDIYSSFLESFATALDPHTSYYSPDQLEEFRISTRLSLEGIGALLQSEDGFTSIQNVVPGGAAAKVGTIKAEDKIVAVAQGDEPPVDVIDMSLREVVKLIRGPRGTEVRLTLVREESSGTKKIVVPIIREKVQLQDRAAKSFVYEVETKEKDKQKYRIGVIELPSFYMDFEGRQARVKDFKSSSKDMLREINNLKKQKVDSIIVDLRNNGGGALDESIKIAGFFFEEGPVVQVKGVNNSPTVMEDEDDSTQYDGPLVVMINRQSASASEILAGAIKDYGRGIIVGDSHTFGKGTVQNLNDLSPQLGAIKVTISNFYTPSGNSTQLKGVDADIVFPSLLDKFEMGEKYYDYALPWEKIPEAKHKNYNQVTSHLAAVKAGSEARVAKDEDFKEVFEAIDEYEKKKKERSRVSLKAKTEEEKKQLAKEREEEEKKEKERLAAMGGEKDSDHRDLKDDPYLKESVLIATDYVRSLSKKKIVDLALKQTTPIGAKTVAENKKKK